MGIERREADYGLAQHRRGEIETGQRGVRSEIVALLRDGEHKRRVVQLVTPRV